MKYPFNNIEKFVQFFGAHIAAVGELPATEEHNRHKKILYLSILDGMSKGVYPHRGNRERFASLIRRFSGWKDAERVSLPHLNQLLSRNPDPILEALRLRANSMLSQWPHGQQAQLNLDPLPREILKLWPKDNDMRAPIAGVTLEHLQHWSLLYSYRNQLVHELQVPAHGLDDYGLGEPFYMRVEMDNAYDGPEAIYHLAYPLQHFHSLCSASLVALRNYLESNALDPLQFFRGGSYFLDELN